MDNKEKLIEYLKTEKMMSVATEGEGLCVCGVYYALDESSMSLYFLSNPSRIHSKNIGKNGKVACAIYDSSQKVTDKKKGVQMQGEGSLVTEEVEMKKALDLWNKAIPGFETILNFENISTNTVESKVYKIIPEKIKFFNEELYGPEGIQDIKINYSNS